MMQLVAKMVATCHQANSDAKNDFMVSYRLWLAAKQP